MDYKKYLASAWAWPITYKVVALIILLLIFDPNSKIAAILFLIVAAVGFIKFLFGENDEETEEGFRRGARLVPPKQLQVMISKSKDATAIQLGLIKIPTSLEPKHFLFVGGTSSGKSLAFNQSLESSRARGCRAIVVDLNGHALSKFYRKDKDFILNPFDGRSEKWSPFSEIKSEYHIDSITKSLVPDGEGADKTWNGYAQNIVAAVLGSMLVQGRTSNGEFYNKLILDSTSDLAELVQGTPAQRDFEKLDTAKLNNTLSIISSQISSFKYLPKDADKNSFSIRNWVHDAGDSWIFINARDDQLDALKPLIGAWLDIAISSLLSTEPLPANSNKLTHFFIDEIASFQIQSLDSLLTKSRKFGGSCFAGLQTISQLQATYGHYQSQTLLSNFSSKLILRQNDSATSEYFSKNLGNREIMRTVEGGSDGEKSSTSYSDQITQEQIVMPSELTNLPDRVGYLNLAGNYPITKIQIQLPKPFTSVAEPFIYK